MEPSEFDQFVKNSLLKESELHANEILHSKPFVWSSVQQNLSKNSLPIRYFLAAAVFLFLCCSSFMLYQFLQKQHQQVILLSNRIESLHQSQANQTKLLSVKEKELNDLRKEMNHLGVSLSSKQEPSPVFTQVIYKTDTVFITKIENSTVAPEPRKEIEEISISTSESKQEELVVNDNKSNLIYPSYAGSTKKVVQSETIKLKLNTFVSN